mgnify:FL=1
MEKKIIKNYFLILFSIIPLSIIIGPSASLINILLIDLSFIIFLIYLKQFNVFEHYATKLLLILYTYLIFNSFIALDFDLSAIRNFGFIRFIILFLSINYFFYNLQNIKIILFFWFIIIIVLIFDSYIERLFGANILGYGARYIDGVEQPYANRIVSFFKDEPIVGGFLSGFFLIIQGYLFKFYYKNNSTIKKVSIISLSILFVGIIVLTGERSNAIKSILALLIFYSFIDSFSIKQKLKIFSLVFILFFCTLTYLLNVKKPPNIKKSYIVERFGTQLFTNFSSIEKIKTFYNDSLYFRIYESGFETFKAYPIFGVGNKNYRFETCKNNNKNPKYVCTTHPHQIYIELLSEHGLIGSIILLSIIFFLIYKSLQNIIKFKDPIQIGCFSYLIVNFIPLLPSGAFFGDFNSTIFWINFSLMYASNSNTNSFKSLNIKLD